ncbi:MAG: AI-2E family transporter [Actinomycetales bacterium]|jgi:predicted PurR-regulated permease PerM|nr:AI-2E family transporter [Actinomycetales bacterium]
MAPSVWERWRGFRARQRARVTEHDHLSTADLTDLAAATDGTDADAAYPSAPTPGKAPANAPPAPERDRPTWQAHSPFRLGLSAGIGLLAAYALWQALGALDTVLTLVVVSVFLTLALNPVVERFMRAGMGRGGAVTVVFTLLVATFGVIGLIVMPPVATQSTELLDDFPGIIRDLRSQPMVQNLDTTYHVLDKAAEEINRRLADGAFMSQVFGGVLGAGMAVLSGVVSVFTVLVLTLYFLSSLPTIKRAAYAMVPASRRPRVAILAEEIMRRVGSYAIGQVLVATINACCSYLMMKIVGIPYAAVLAVVVGLLGLIPMVGATLGALVVALVALFGDPVRALIALTYFLVYQQIENYLISPRIMQRTVSVPGAVTIIAAMVGGALAGVLGALLAIPTAAGLLLLYEEVLVPRQAAR